MKKIQMKRIICVMMVFVLMLTSVGVISKPQQASAASITAPSGDSYLDIDSLKTLGNGSTYYNTSGELQRISFAGKKWYAAGAEILGGYDTLILMTAEIYGTDAFNGNTCDFDDSSLCVIMNEGSKEFSYETLFKSDSGSKGMVFSDSGMNRLYVPHYVDNDNMGVGRTVQYSIPISRYTITEEDNSTIPINDFWLQENNNTGNIFFCWYNGTENEIDSASPQAVKGVLSVLNVKLEDVLFASDITPDHCANPNGMSFRLRDINNIIGLEATLSEDGIKFDSDSLNAELSKDEEYLCIQWCEDGADMYAWMRVSNIAENCNGDNILSADEVKDFLEIASTSAFEFNENVKVWIEEQVTTGLYRAKPLEFHSHQWNIGTKKTHEDNDTLTAYCTGAGTCSLGYTESNPFEIVLNTDCEFEYSSSNIEGQLYADYTGSETLEDLLRPMKDLLGSFFHIEGLFYEDYALNFVTDTVKDGATSYGKEPVNEGTYYYALGVSGESGPYPAKAVVSFKITPKLIEEIQFKAPDVTAGGTPAGVADLGLYSTAPYSTEIEWTDAAGEPVGDSFGYNKEYKAVITFKADRNLCFGCDGELSTAISNHDGGRQEGWKTEMSADGKTLTITKTFGPTRKAVLVTVGDPEVPESFRSVQSAEAQISSELPTTVAVETEDKEIKELGIAWDYDRSTYSEKLSTDTEPVVNTFTWKITEAGLNLVDYASQDKLSGIAKIKNTNGIGTIKIPEINVEENKKITTADDLNIDSKQPYTAESVTWTDSEGQNVGDRFDFNTVYTVQIVLKTKDGALFGLIGKQEPEIPAGWSSKLSADGKTITLTKTFDATRKAKLLSVTAPKTPETFQQVAGAASQISSELPSVVAVVTEDNSISEMAVTWTYNKNSYSAEPSDYNGNGKTVENEFYWEITDKSLSDFDYSGTDTKGTVYVKNPVDMKYVIDNVEFMETEPDPAKSPASVKDLAIKEGVSYTAEALTWTCTGNDAAVNAFDFSTEYTATIVLKAKSGYTFGVLGTLKTVAPEGWTVTMSADEKSLTLTKKYVATRKVKLLNVTAPKTPGTFRQIADAATQISTELPASVTVKTERGEIGLNITWSYDKDSYNRNYSVAGIPVSNTFTWTITDDKLKELDYLESDITGNVTIGNPEKPAPGNDIPVAKIVEKTPEVSDKESCPVSDEVLENAAAFLKRYYGTTVSATALAKNVLKDAKHNAYYLVMKEAPKAENKKDADKNFGELMYLGPIKTKNRIKVVSKVTINNAVYHVTSINTKVFANLTKIKKVIVGVYVEKLGDKVFSNMSDLTKVQFNTKKLTKESAGKNLFADSSSDIMVYARKAVYEKYTKLFADNTVVEFIYKKNKK